MSVVDRHTGRIVVGLAPRIAREIADRARQDAGFEISDLHEAAKALQLADLQALLAEFPVVESRPTVRARSIKAQADVEAGMRPRAPFRARGLVGFFTLDARQLSESARSEFVRRLKGLRDIVATAYLESTYESAGTGATDQVERSYTAHQEYLDAAPRGVGARANGQWRVSDGAGVKFVDIESAWNLDHECLAGRNPPIHPGNGYDPNEPLTGRHGTAVLGVVLAPRAGLPICGVAPGSALASLVSPLTENGESVNVAEAIALATDELGFGDVLLLEMQTTGKLPVEVNPAEFAAIELAASKGIVVIEPAGNGPWDLDRVSADPELAPAWDLALRQDPNRIPDSGAILVSGCRSDLEPHAPEAHRRVPDFGYGSRVDCFAWGEHVVTAGTNNPPSVGGVHDPGSLDPNKWYDSRFGGTSAASAIIAGVALVVQQMAEQTLGYRLSPFQLRELLRHRAGGTRILGGRRPGVMPDLARVPPRLWAVTEVSIRGSPEDSGVQRSGAVPPITVPQSPDIIVRHSRSDRPQHEYGALVSVGEAEPNGDHVAPLRVHYIYLRLRNLGDAEAKGVRASVYWSVRDQDEDAPVVWQEVGSTRGVTLPPRGECVVAGPIEWIPPATLAPTSRAIDLLAAAGHRLDPRPPLPWINAGAREPVSRRELVALVSRHNNVAIRTCRCA